MDKRIIENLRVKNAIVEGFFELLKSYNVDDISITMISQQSKVSRMAYYRNFNCKNDIILYFLESVFCEIKESLPEECEFWSKEYGYVFLTIMKKYRAQFLLLDNAGYLGMVQSMFNEANIELGGEIPYNSIKRYNLYFASGAALNGIMEWFRNECKESLDEFYQALIDFMGANINNPGISAGIID